jgi:hypothetical protein
MGEEEENEIQIAFDRRKGNGLQRVKARRPAASHRAKQRLHWAVKINVLHV